MKAQNTAHLSAGTYFAQDYFSFRYEGLYNRWKGWIRETPTYQVSVSYQRVFGEHLLLGVGLQSFFYRVNFENSEFRDGSGFINDLKPEYSVRNYLVPFLSIGYTTDKTERFSFFALGSFRYALPTNAYDRVTYPDGSQEELPPYQSTDDYKEGLMHGPGLRLGAAFSPRRTLEKQWLSYQLALDSQLLFYSESDFNPKFLFGPELSVAYNF